MSIDQAELCSCLVSGGDDRLLLDPSTRVNMYGYGPSPSPDDLAFSSSTASTISARGFDAAAQTFERLQTALATGDANTVYTAEMEGVRDRLRKALGLDPADVDVVLAASGTDLHLIIAALLQGLHKRPVLTVSLTGSETGSGIGLAASGRHAMPHPVSGRDVIKGDPIGETLTLGSAALPVRDPEGNLRAETSIAAELTTQIAAAIGSGAHCILVATDVSKTGLIAPALETIFALKQQFGEQLTVLVDACQMRVSPETVQAYLAKGCIVAVTGSKFVAGPIFSGALLIPKDLATRCKSVPIATEIGDYSGAGDWPAGWAATSLPPRPNFGLLLRWHAALIELERFLGHHPLKLAWVAMRFADVVEARLKSDPRFEPVPGRRLDRSLVGTDIGYDAIPTIFPFLLKRDTGLLTAPEMTAIYQELAASREGRSRVRLGQPVALGQRAGQPIAALRLCLSAPLISDALESSAALDRMITNALTALDLAAELAKQSRLRVA